MKFGLIARADDRGIGIQTWEIARHLLPDQVLVVSMGELAGGFKSYPERYTALGLDVSVLPHDELGESNAVRKWLQRLGPGSVVYTVETFYDWRFVKVAREYGVRTVCHLNPEFFPSYLPEEDHPTAWWAPTTWHLDRLPSRTVLMPQPVPTDRWPEAEPQLSSIAERRGHPLRVLHTAGHRAMSDRNGTLAFFGALRKVTQPMEVTVITQDPRLPAPTTPRNVTYRRVLGGVADYWRMYDGHDALALPRRYGGLCLPVQEAAGAGLAITMPDVSPNRECFPARLTRTSRSDMIETSLGSIEVHHPSAASLAQVLDDWAADRDLLHDDRRASWEWAQVHSWDALAPRWREGLAAVAEEEP